VIQGKTAPRELAVRVGQVLVAVGTIAWFVTSIRWGPAFATVSDMSASTIAILVGISVLGQVLIMTQWYLVVTVFEEISFARVTETVLVNLFVGQFIPSRAGTFALLPVLLRRTGKFSYSQGVASVMAHTGWYGLLYALVAAIGLVLLEPVLSRPMFVLVLTASVMYGAIGGAFVVLAVRPGTVERLVATTSRVLDVLPVSSSLSPGTILDRFTGEVINDLQSVMYSWRIAPLFCIAWLGAIVIVPSIRVWIVLTSTADVTISVVVLAPTLVTAYSVTSLPLSPGGVGVTEVTATVVLAAAGVPTEIAALAILVDRVIGVYVPALVGGGLALQLDVDPFG
jgi:uncharacterized protein (TIRG00374 family)